MKEKILKTWLTYPMYGYPRMTIYFKENLNTLVNAYLIYPLIRELSIQSRMIKKIKTLNPILKLFNYLI
ncbi:MULTISPECIES: transposase [unclassified Enterococcus]|uniref:transposase n=1 Tax=unclassified Enterococcus TaxID=2608891 RepID=UPI0034E8719B